MTTIVLGADDVTDPHATGGATGDRMNRNAMALVLSSVLTSALGFLFWLAAASLLTIEQLGLGSAAVAAVVLLGNIATLGLRNALQRFLPAAGRSSGLMIRRVYAVSALAGALLAFGFVLGSDIWAAELAAVHRGVLAPALFVVSVAVWTVFVLQDSVLVGLRAATWVPVENLAYSVAKLGLLLVLAPMGGWLLPVAWVVPALLALAPMNAAIFLRLLPRMSRQAPARRRTDIDWSAVRRFASGDFASDVVGLLATQGVVLLVLERAGPSDSGALFVSFTISASLNLVAANVMSAFVAEAAARPRDEDALLLRAAWQVTRLVVPAALIGALIAPFVLRLFGDEYRGMASTTLRVLLLATVPAIPVALATSVARLRNTTWVVASISAAAAVGPIIGASLFVGRYGIVAVAWSTLIGNTLLAVVLTRTVLWSLVGSIARAGVDRSSRVRSAVQAQRRHRAAAPVFDELDATRHGRASLRPRRLVETTNDTAVALVDVHPPLVVKVALSDASSAGLAAHRRALETLGSATAGTLAGSLLPQVVESDVCGGQAYVVETACVGAAAGSDPASLRSMAAAIGALHRVTMRRSRAADELADAIVHRPARVVAAHLDPERATVLSALVARLDCFLQDTEVVVARTHGDFWPGNVLVVEAQGQPVVTGIVDWENSLATGLPEVDLAHLWLSVQPDGLADAVRRGADVHDLRELLGPCATDAVNDHLEAGSVVMLAWLAHVAAGLERADTFRVSRHWLRLNVHDVLDAWSAVSPMAVRGPIGVESDGADQR